MLNYLPKYFTTKAITFYFIAVVSVSFIFFQHVMAWYWFVFGAAEVVGFFYFSNLLSKKWSVVSPKLFAKRVFITAVVLRIAWVVFSYFFYMYMNGEPYEFGAADSHAYNTLAMDGAAQFRLGNFNTPQIFGYLQVGDYGYSTYLSFVYFLTGNNIFIARILKAFWGAWTCLLIYKLAVRNFGENAGRIAAVFCMLMPNLIYYCGLQLKEVEMVFLSMAFVERADYLIRSKNFNFINIFLPFLLAFLLFTFRTVLGAVAVFALFTALIFSSHRVTRLANRILVAIWLVAAIAYFAGGTIATEVEQTWENRTTNQEEGMAYRASRKGGNVFANRASKAIFAPAIFIIPIPSMVQVEGQENQVLIHGGNVVKDVLIFFFALAFIWILRDKKWRDFTLLMAFMFGYLMVIAFSNFVQSERFHQPALPLILMFAAYGVSRVTNNQKKYFYIYLVLIFVVFVVWNYIKLAGRGMV